MKKNFLVDKENNTYTFSTKKRNSHISLMCASVLVHFKHIKFAFFQRVCFLLWAVNCVRAHFTQICMTFIFLLKWTGNGNPCKIRKIIEIWYTSVEHMMNPSGKWLIIVQYFEKYLKNWMRERLCYTKIGKWKKGTYSPNKTKLARQKSTTIWHVCAELARKQIPTAFCCLVNPINAAVKLTKDKLCQDRYARHISFHVFGRIKWPLLFQFYVTIGIESFILNTRWLVVKLY